jgi:ATP-dependent Lon protease
MFDNHFIGPSDEEMDFLPILTDDSEDDGVEIEYKDQYPLVPLRNMVLFPGVVLPITVGRDKSIKAIKAAYKKDRIVAVVSQVDGSVEEPETHDLFKTGTLARILKMLKMPDGTTTVILQGRSRFRVNRMITEEPFFLAETQVLPDNAPKNKKEFEAIISSMNDLAKDIIELSPQIPSEAGIVLKNITKPAFLIHFIASNLNVEPDVKQQVLEIEDLEERGRKVLELLNNELQMLELKTQIQNKVKGDIEKQQRDYFLHQQMKKIQEELGGDSISKEIENLKERAEDMEWPKEVAETFQKEIQKLERTNPAAAEYSVLINYCELLLDLPWSKYTKDNFDLTHAKKVLDQDHFGLDKIKDRVLEYLAVLKLKGDLKSPILCFVGPPGVGKTSLGRSIARALDRKYVRMSLGGLHDESEIRGHRKTYIGAMPGRIIQSLKKVKTSNPVFILDEIDKVGSDFRGDPSSALLEVLDPEQNTTFYDNYLELEYDLSKVMFIATANSLNTIHPALRDRMEIIFLDGYSLEEKVEIARKYLVPKQREAHGLKASQVTLTNTVLAELISSYTRESGVRELDRVIAAVMRNVAKRIALGEAEKVSVSKPELKEILGSPKYDRSMFQGPNPPGVSIGLAYTAVGGDILFIEATLTKGKGQLKLTGNLGDVMKESASTALSFLQAHAPEYRIPQEIFENVNIHIHVPEGAVPKDGPSAGVTLLTALTSLLTQRKVKPDLAMTGEITLRGKVLPVGGIKEKILAAKRAGMKDIILPKVNQKDVEEIQEDYIKSLNFHYVEDMAQVLDLAVEKKAVKNPIKLSEFIPQVG